MQDYRRALLRMEGFLHHLKAEVVFHYYANSPSQSEYQRLTEFARGNISFACEFLRAKLVSVAIIEALSMETGGDSPVSMFLGDISSTYGKPERAEDFLPLANSVENLNPFLLGVFEQGRSAESAVDLNASPLTAFIYRTLGDQGLAHAWQYAQMLFAEESTSLDFLKNIDCKLIVAITHACEQIAISRQKGLRELQVKLANEP